MLVQRRNVELGFADYFEVELELLNASQMFVTLYTTCNDPDLEIVDSVTEREHFRWINKIKTPMEIFDYQRKDKSFTTSPKTVQIPLKYQTFKWPGKKGETVITKESQIKFASVDNSIVFELCVEITLFHPSAYPRLTIFKDYHNPLEQAISIPQLPISIFNGNGFILLSDCIFHCTDKIFKVVNFAAPSYVSRSTVLLISRSKSKELRNQFFTYIYADIFYSRPVQVWHMNVVTPMPIMIQPVLGTIQMLNLEYSGGSESRVVKCSYYFSDFIDCPNGNFVITPNEVNKLAVTVRGKSVGSSTHAVQLIDVDDCSVVFAWTLYIECHFPDNA